MKRRLGELLTDVYVKNYCYSLFKNTMLAFFTPLYLCTNFFLNQKNTKFHSRSYWYKFICWDNFSTLYVKYQTEPVSNWYLIGLRSICKTLSRLTFSEWCIYRSVFSKAFSTNEELKNVYTIPNCPITEIVFLP